MLNESKFGITAKEIMNDNFPIIDASRTLEECIKQMKNRNEACVIMKEGVFKSIISYNDLLKAFFSRTRNNIPLEKMRSSRNFVIVEPDTDISKIINLLGNGKKEFLVVKDKTEFGLITGKEIADVNKMLFDRLWKREK